MTTNTPELKPLPNLWKWSRPYKTNSENSIKVEDSHGRVIFTGFCRSDDDAELMVKSVNARISSDSHAGVSDEEILDIAKDNPPVTAFQLLGEVRLRDIHTQVLQFARALLSRQSSTPSQPQDLSKCPKCGGEAD